jgi:putative addiction module component (TIGR02574 family)
VRLSLDEFVGRRLARYTPAKSWQERISVDPLIRSGKPHIKGTRITVYDILEYLAGGMSEDEILADFPDLSRDDIRASLSFVAQDDSLSLTDTLRVELDRRLDDLEREGPIGASWDEMLDRIRRPRT